MTDHAVAMERSFGIRWQRVFSFSARRSRPRRAPAGHSGFPPSQAPRARPLTAATGFAPPPAARNSTIRLVAMPLYWLPQSVAPHLESTVPTDGERFICTALNDFTLRAVSLTPYVSVSESRSRPRKMSTARSGGSRRYSEDVPRLHGATLQPSAPSAMALHVAGSVVCAQRVL